MADHVAWQADWPGDHYRSVAGGPSRIDEDSALPFSEGTSRTTLIHPPTSGYENEIGLQRFLQGASTTSTSFP